MFSPFKFIFLFSVILLINPTFSQQPYDSSNCYSSQSNSKPQGYICSSNDSNCDTYIIYRAQHNFNSIASIASLFNSNHTNLLKANNLNEENSRILQFGQEVIIPIECRCLNGLFRSPFKCNISSQDSPNLVACDVFEGLVKAQTLIQENQDLWESHQINVPIRCACPNSIQRSNGVKFLVTYPVLEGDNPHLIAYKFNVTAKAVADANNLKLRDSIFPKTTLLVPVNDLSNVSWNIPSVPGISPAPKSTFKVIPTESTKWGNSHVFLGAGVGFAVATMVISFRVFRNIQRMNNPERFHPLPARKSAPLDFLDGVSKLKNSIISYSLEEIRIATDNFREDSVITKNIYRGTIGSSCLAIERMDSEEIARGLISLLTKINHFNIVRLQGFCGESNPPFLVSDYPENGSLRKCLSSLKSNLQLTWAKRLQIAFDIAAALHYLHNSIAPPFVHCDINSRNVLLTEDWRAKICGFGMAKPVIEAVEGKADDVFAFGVVLLELVSGREIKRDGEIVLDSIDFVKESRDSMENLRGFVDPVMEGNFGEGDALCLVRLAKSCIEKDPQNRPTMNDIIIALSRIIV